MIVTKIEEKFRVGELQKIYIFNTFLLAHCTINESLSRMRTCLMINGNIKKFIVITFKDGCKHLKKIVQMMVLYLSLYRVSAEFFFLNSRISRIFRSFLCCFSRILTKYYFPFQGYFENYPTIIKFTMFFHAFDIFNFLYILCEYEKGIFIIIIKIYILHTSRNEKNIDTNNHKNS